jgi:hypothetical protein
MMANRQNSVPSFGNTTPTSFSNTNMSFTSTNPAPDHGIGQLQQIAPSGFGTQQIGPFSNGQPNQSNGLLPQQQKNLFNSNTNQNQNQNQWNNNNYLFSTINGNGFMKSSTTSTNSGWPNMNH